MSPTTLCSTGLHSTFLPGFCWFLGAPMIRMIELRTEDMNTLARGLERLPPLAELSAWAPACGANAEDTEIKNKTPTKVDFMCNFPWVTVPNPPVAEQCLTFENDYCGIGSRWILSRPDLSDAK
jgi:hypothetical protein